VLILAEVHRSVLESIALELYEFGIVIQVVVVSDRNSTPSCFDAVENANNTNSKATE